jgi:hypothetical protein
MSRDPPHACAARTLGIVGIRPREPRCTFGLELPRELEATYRIECFRYRDGSNRFLEPALARPIERLRPSRLSNQHVRRKPLGTLL